MTPSVPSAPIPAERIFSRLAEFVAYVRLQGVSVGVGGELDLARALGTLAILDRRTFRAACRVTLAKSPMELDRLDAAFERFWSPDLPLVGPPRSRGGPPSIRPRAIPAAAHDPGRALRPSEPTRVPSLPFGVYSAAAPPPGHVLQALPDRAMRDLHRGARRFRHVTATLPGRRTERARRGMIDFAATFRHNLRHGGEWLELRHRHFRPGRSELVLLWDVSGSMREHDSGLFGLVHALTRVVRSSRVFAFSTRVEEITADVQAFGYRRSAARVGARVDRTEGGTRIGACLSQFVAGYGSLVRASTTVLVLSDGWDLGEADLVGTQLEWIARRARILVWVNPYARQHGFSPETGALRAALPYIDLLLAPEDFASSPVPRASPAVPRRAGTTI